jgi:hypothetical protein
MMTMAACTGGNSQRVNLDWAHMASLAIALPIYGDADDMDARERIIYNFLHFTQILTPDFLFVSG